eukprot:Skav203071  [mRNA]  locus=scaffold363:90227:90874:- [translate_table: standard]
MRSQQSEHKKDSECVMVKSSECGQKYGHFYDGWEPSTSSTPNSEDEQVMCCRKDPPYDILWLDGSPEDCLYHGFRYFNSTTKKDGKKCATVEWPYATCFMASQKYCGPQLAIQRTEDRYGNPVDGNKLLGHSYSGWGYKYLGNNQCCWLSSDRRFSNYVCRETNQGSYGCMIETGTLATSTEFGKDMGPDPTSSSGQHRCCGTSSADVQILPARD